MKRDYSSILNITNEILSSIPPFVMYNVVNKLDIETNRLYVDMFLDSDITVMQRARIAWMFDFYLTKDMTDVVPLAIQIEIFLVILSWV